LVTVRPVTVVEDTEQVLALYSHAGGSCRTGAMQGRQHLPIEERVRVYLSDEQPRLRDVVMRSNVLTLTPPDAGHSIWLFWDSDWAFKTWYVNLQQPVQRTPRGVIVRDYLLDLVVTPALVWAWKDEDEFEAVYAAGGFSGGEHARIRDEGWRMVERIETRGWPFDSNWPAWRPDPSWQMPALCTGGRAHEPPVSETATKWLRMRFDDRGRRDERNTLSLRAARR
jgi:hypothetical protein